MAKIAFGGIATDARGKLGDIVYSKNRWSSYARTKTIPTNPKTGAQTFVRTIMTNGSRYWSASLTAAQRASWNSFAKLLKRSNTLGQDYLFTGFHAFLQAYMNNFIEGNNVIPTPPALPLATQPTSLTVVSNSIAGSDLTIGWSPTPGLPIIVQLWFTPALPAGHTWIKNLLRLTSIQSSSTEPFNAFANYTGRFGAPTAGQSVGVVLYLRDRSSAQKSVGLQTTFTWNA